MKYQFEWGEIKSCIDCPFKYWSCISGEAFCKLSELSITYNPKPDDCPLKEIKEDNENGN